MGSTAIHDKGESTVRKSFRLAAGVVALGLVAAACSEDNGTSSGTTAGGAATTAASADHHGDVRGDRVQRGPDDGGQLQRRP